MLYIALVLQVGSSTFCTPRIPVNFKHMLIVMKESLACSVSNSQISINCSVPKSTVMDFDCLSHSVEGTKPLMELITIIEYETLALCHTWINPCYNPYKDCKPGFGPKNLVNMSSRSVSDQFSYFLLSPK